MDEAVTFRDAVADDALTFRDAVIDDAPTLGVLALQVFLDTYATDGISPSLAREALAHCSTEATAALLTDRATQIIVAERGGHMIGFAQIRIGAAQPHAAPDVAPDVAPDLASDVTTTGVDDEPTEGAVELARLYVHERYTGSGVGTALLRRAEERAARNGAPALWLTAWAGNHRARAFYARRGYDDRGATTYTFEGEQYENRLLVRSLSAPEAR